TGSGLGLAIVREVAESHGGTVMLERPASGHGARFVVRLRPVPPPARRRATPAPAWLAQANQPPAGAEHANSQPPVSDPGEPR
ncbi:MAG: ATP-binding protein, partial [Solirubrobacteraceae bacterium]